MAFVVADRVKETTTTVGTGAVALAGAVTGFRTFASGIGNSNTTYYTIASQTANEWEVGFGTLDATSANLARTTVLASSNSGSLVTFSAGTKDVFVTQSAARTLVQASGGTTTNGVLYYTGSGVATGGSALTFDGIEVFKNSGGTIQYNDVRGSAAAGTRMSAGGTLGTDSFDLFQNASIAGIYNRASTPIAFAISSIEQMRLTSTGLGIGTSSPSNTLTVQGSVAYNVNSTTDVYKYFTGGAGLVYAGTTTATAIAFITSGSEKMRLDTSGNLGIGTSSPSSRLDVTGGNIVVDGFSSGYGIAFRQGFETTANLKIYASDPGGFSRNGALFLSAYDGICFGTNSNTFQERMRITNTGAVGIGTSSPNAKLVVSNAGAAGLEINPISGFLGGAYLQGYNRSTSAFIPVEVIASSFGVVLGTTQALTLNSSGNLGLGVTPSAWSTGKAMQIGSGAADLALFCNNNDANISSNAYYNGGWKYQWSTSVAASRYQQTNGTHVFYNAVAGTAGNSIAFNTLANFSTAIYFYKNLSVGNPITSLWDSNGSVISNQWNALWSPNDYPSQSDYLVNAYYNGTDYVYLNDDAASMYRQYGGAHTWWSAASGFAGDPISPFYQYMTLNVAGNLGLGTTSPGVKLDVNIGGTPPSASAGTVARVVSAGGAGFDAIFGIVGGNAGRSIIDFGDTDSPLPGRIAYEHNNNAFAFTTAATERMRLDSSGNFMVGKSSAVNKIETVGAGVDGNGVVSGVGITPSTIYTIKQSSTGALCVVFGDDGSNGFMDLVFFLATVTPQVITSKTMYGSPGGRTYSTTTTALKCSIGSGTQNIRTAVLSTLGT